MAILRVICWALIFIVRISLKQIVFTNRMILQFQELLIVEIIMVDVNSYVSIRFHLELRAHVS